MVITISVEIIFIALIVMLKVNNNRGKRRLRSGVGAKDHWSLDLDQKDHIIEIKMIKKKLDHQ